MLVCLATRPEFSVAGWNHNQTVRVCLCCFPNAFLHHFIKVPVHWWKSINVPFVLALAFRNIFYKTICIGQMPSFTFGQFANKPSSIIYTQWIRNHGRMSISNAKIDCFAHFLGVLLLSILWNGRKLMCAFAIVFLFENVASINCFQTEQYRFCFESHWSNFNWFRTFTRPASINQTLALSISLANFTEWNWINFNFTLANFSIYNFIASRSNEYSINETRWIVRVCFFCIHLILCWATHSINFVHFWI